MADPLSIAASIAGLATLADIVFSCLVKYGRMAKNADKEIQSLMKEVNLLAGALDSLKRLARALEHGEFDRNIRIHHIEACNVTLMEMERTLKKASDKSVKQRLLWPLRNERVKEWLEELSRHKENINLALSANSLDAMLRLLAQEDRHATELVAEIKDTRRITSRIHEDLQRRKVLDFFLRYNPQQNYEMSLRLRHPRTGLWLQRLTSFRHWLETPDSKLWLKGIPGAGKTVLAGSIIETVLGRSTDIVASAFFFCDYKDTRTQDVDNIMMTLVYQLGIQNETAYTRMEQYYKELHPSRGLPMAPKTSVLRRLLRDMTKLYDHVYLVVDGIDECGKLANEVIETLFEVSEETENISMALSSRDEDDIRDHLEEDFVSVEIAAHKEDITEYVTAEIEQRIQNRKLRIDDPNLKGEILEGLVDGAKGMFRWVACQLDHLRLCDSDQQCRDALKTLPPDLNTSYARILERVPEKKMRMVQLALSCIAYSTWPKLTIRQLREMLSVPSPGTYLEPGAIIREGAVTKYCSSLIRKSADKLRFEFSHSSVQEFLENDSLRRSDLSAFWISRSCSEALLAIECLKFLRLKNFNHTNVDWETSGSDEESGEESDEESSEETDADFELYPYAASQWFRHASGEWENKIVLEHAQALFHPSKTNNFTSWVRQLVNSWKQDKEEDLHEDDLLHLLDVDFTPLHMAATLSLSYICAFLLEQGMQVDTKSPLGRPLQCAVQGPYFLGSSSSLMMDRTTKDEPANEEDPGDTGTIGTIECLVRAGASLRLRCTYPYSDCGLLDVAFDNAFWRNSLNVPTTLLQLGAPLDHLDVEVAQAAFEDLRGIGDKLELESLWQLVQTLNVCVDKSPKHLELCRLAWKEAIFFKMDSASDSTKIDTRVSLTDGDLAEQAVEAVRGGNLQALQRILRDPRIDAPSIVDSEGDSLLHLALYYESCSEDISIFKLLLDAGCDISKINLHGEQPLQLWYWDLTGGNDKQIEVTDEVAGLLRELGASCSHQDKEGRNALHITSIHQCGSMLF